MRPRPRPLLVLGFVLAMAAVWVAYAPPSPTMGRALKDAEARLNEFYRGGALPPGWRLAEVSVVSRRHEVWVDVRLADAAAAALAERPRPAIAAAVARLCPPISDPVWRILQPRQEIEVRAATESGQVLAAVNCRAAAR
ncbi:MAG: hypothetical protein HYW28_08890 [Rhodospirillales bacterium]|nr:hypothetical protein [Rhodospirillales bacterium]